MGGIIILKIQQQVCCFLLSCGVVEGNTRKNYLTPFYHVSDFVWSCTPQDHFGN